jgi:hypothetical protein
MLEVRRENFIVENSKEKCVWHLIIKYCAVDFHELLENFAIHDETETFFMVTACCLVKVPEGRAGL